MCIGRERLQALMGRKGKYDFDAFVLCTREGVKWLENLFYQNWKTKPLGSKRFLVKQLLITSCIPSIEAEKLFYWWMELLSKVNRVRKSRNATIEITLVNSGNMITINVLFHFRSHSHEVMIICIYAGN